MDGLVENLHGLIAAAPVEDRSALLLDIAKRLFIGLPEMDGVDRANLFLSAAPERKPHSAANLHIVLRQLTLASPLLREEIMAQMTVADLIKVAEQAQERRHDLAEVIEHLTRHRAQARAVN